MVYKPPKYTKQQIYRFTKQEVLIAMDTTEQELQRMASSGSQEAKALLADVEEHATTLSNYYSPKGNNFS
jgi:hypothetical protein